MTPENGKTDTSKPVGAPPTDGTLPDQLRR